MKSKYVCTECFREIPWSKYHEQSDIFCSECGGHIEEIVEDLTIKKQAIQPPTIYCPSCNEVNFSWKTACSICGKNLNAPKQSSNLMSCPHCSAKISKRAELCPKCNNAILKKCFVCENKIRENSQNGCPECGDPYPFTNPENSDTGENSKLLLKPCPSCGCSLSERASHCSQCKTVTIVPCKVCGENISCWSQACTECGDPNPFDPQEKSNISGSAFLSKPSIQNRGKIATDPNNSPQKFSLSWFLFSFEGRIGRQSFWCVYPIFLILSLVFSVAFELIKESRNMNGLYIVIILSILFLWSSVAIQVKRWHDRNKSGNWILLNIIPILGFVWVITELGFLKGTEGNNVYGADPLSK